MASLFGSVSGPPAGVETCMSLQASFATGPQCQSFEEVRIADYLVPLHRSRPAAMPTIPHRARRPRRAGPAAALCALAVSRVYCVVAVWRGGRRERVLAAPFAVFAAPIAVEGAGEGELRQAAADEALQVIARAELAPSIVPITLHPSLSVSLFLLNKGNLCRNVTFYDH
ncbi:hypothetical protein C8R45DRAFT_1212647 [Mycena sanguinolenta]|nr:hypothetical protein C8R45DRAFT_1212647 [Mycena sanguinolenta]